MTVTERDIALLQEELKCLRDKLGTMVSTAGGYTDQLTSPGSSIYPDEYREGCGCIDVQVDDANPQDFCQTTDGSEGEVGVGDLVEQVYVPGSIQGLFYFDAIEGVYYKPPDENTWQNRNTGLADTTLEHGCMDVWWYRKNTPNDDNVILYTVGVGKVLCSKNAGRIGWQNRTPTPPDGYTAGQITFTQIISDPFTPNAFYLLATNEARTWVVRTADNFQTTSWLDVTNYNAAVTRIPIWMAVSGNGGLILWVTTWADNEVRLLKINNGSPMTVSAEYSMGAATLWETKNWYNVLSPACPLDGSTVYLFGRHPNPASLGLSHIIKSVDEGLNWTAVEQSWGLDWCGSLRIAMGDDIYAVRNVRGAYSPPVGNPVLIGATTASTGFTGNYSTGFSPSYFFDNYGDTSKLYRSSLSIDPDTNLPVLSGRSEVYDAISSDVLGNTFYNPDSDTLVFSGLGVSGLTPPSGSSVEAATVGTAGSGDYLTSTEMVYGSSPGFPSDMRFAWITGNNTGNIRALVVDSSSIQLAVKMLTSNYALGVYRNASGNVAAKLLYRNAGGNTLDNVGEDDSTYPVVNTHPFYLFRMAGNTYAFIFHNGTQYQILTIDATIGSVVINAPTNVLSGVANLRGAVVIDTTHIGVAWRDSSDYLFKHIDTSGTESTTLTVYTSPGSIWDSPIELGYVDGHILYSYIEPAGNLKVASIAI